jgi:hypothetical protein
MEVFQTTGLFPAGIIKKTGKPGNQESYRTFCQFFVLYFHSWLPGFQIHSLV